MLNFSQIITFFITITNVSTVGADSQKTEKKAFYDSPRSLFYNLSIQDWWCNGASLGWRDLKVVSSSPASASLIHDVSVVDAHLRAPLSFSAHAQPKVHMYVRVEWVATIVVLVEKQLGRIHYGINFLNCCWPCKILWLLSSCLWPVTLPHGCLIQWSKINVTFNTDPRATITWIRES